MNNFAAAPLEKYLSGLSSNMPVPGGGSASALVAAAGVACLEMAANFTTGKKGYEKYEKEIKSISGKLFAARSRLVKLVDEDAVAYEALSSAYKLPKNTEAEKKERKRKIQKSLKGALYVPLNIMKISSFVLPYAGRLFKICNQNLITDAGCGAAFLRAAIEGANLNVRINLKYILDASLANQVKSISKTCLKTARISEKILPKIFKKLT